jgi:hypothetical protein
MIDEYDAQIAHLLARRDYNDIFRAQIESGFAENPDANCVKVLYMLHKRDDSKSVLGLDSNYLYHSCITLLPLEYSRGIGFSKHDIERLDTYHRQPDAAEGDERPTSVPRFVHPDVYTERQVEILKKFGQIHDD